MVVLGIVCAAVAALVASARRPAPRRAIVFRPQSVVLQRRAARGAGVAARRLRPDAAGLAARRRGGGAGDVADRVAARVERPRAPPARARRVEARFAAQFPGRIERLTDEESVLVWREVRTPTRMLHPATDCYRGLGYRIVDARLERDAQARLWRCFVAERDGRRLRVCERIEDARGLAFTDASSLVLGGPARPLDRALAGDHGGDAAREPDMSPRDSACRRRLARLAAARRRRRASSAPSRWRSRRCSGSFVAAGAVLLATALYALRAAPGDWSVRAAVGPLGVSLSVPSLLRVATHPLGIRLLDGRSVATRHGTLHARAGATPTIADRALRALRASTRASSRRGRCASTRSRRASSTATANQLHGMLRADRVRATWRGRLGTQSADLELQARRRAGRRPASPCSARRCRRRRRHASTAGPARSCAWRCRQAATRSSRGSTAWWSRASAPRR